MILCSREEANGLLAHESNLFKNDERNGDLLDYETILLKHGRGEGVPNRTDEQRKEIATLALTSGLSNDEVAKLVGCSTDSVNAYKHGATSEATYNEPNEALVEHVVEIKEQIKTVAKNKLLLALESLTPEKVALAKARDAASIARNMAAVVKDMEPDGPLVMNNKIVVYQPRVKDEDDFDVIEVKEV